MERDIKDFGYLIQYITNDEITNIENNKKYIIENRNEILNRIDAELKKDRLQEENLVSRKTAELNLNNLKKIIEEI